MTPNTAIGHILRPTSALQIGAAIAVGIALGLIAAAVNTTFALAGLAGLLILSSAFIVPELVVLMVLALASGLIPSRFNPSLDLIIGHLQVSDLLVLWLLFVVFLRVFTDKSIHFTRTPIDLPVLLFCGAVLVGLGTAVYRFGINFSTATWEARWLMYYLIFFAVTNLIRTRAQQTRLLQGVLAIALLLALTMILQSSLTASWLPEVSGTWQVGGLVRVSNRGFPVVYVAFLALISLMSVRGTASRSFWKWSQVLLLGTALFVAITRNVFVSITAGCLLLVAILSKTGRSRLFQSVLGLSLLGIGLGSLLMLAGWESKVIEYSAVFYDRILRMFSPEILAPSENLVPRFVEIRYAWSEILKNPILGIGLYSPYRPPFYPGEPSYMQTYIHVAVLSLWLKTGIFGLVSFLWFSTIFLRCGFRRWRRVQDDFLRPAVLGLTVAYAGLMLSNLVAPSMVQPEILPVFGIVLGLQQSIILNSDAEKVHD